MGSTAEGHNTAHQKKQLSDAERLAIAKRLNIPLSAAQIKAAEFYSPAVDSDELVYLHQQRKKLGGYLPIRQQGSTKLTAPQLSFFDAITGGSKERKVSTTMAFVRILSLLLKDKALGKFIVPIVPDEARTFGMEGLFSSVGIYSHCGQRYQPVDAKTIFSYREATDGQILQEGICETGGIASFLAAGTAYSIYGVPTIPFYIFYSIFGFQRVGDMIWACGDMLCKGFLLGATAGRTTLNGEGLQHQDGHSQLVASTVENLISYDPAFAYELVVIIRDGIYRMYEKQENIFYYITLYNENYIMPAMKTDGDMHHDSDIEKGILKGIYCYQRSESDNTQKIHLLGSGSLMTEVLRAAEILAHYNVAADIWSVTSYNELYRDALNQESWNRLNPQEKPRQAYIEHIMEAEDGLFIAVSDYVKAVPERLSKWFPDDLVVLGTDGFGLSEARDTLREHFQVSAEYIAYTALHSLYVKQKISFDQLTQARNDLKIKS